MTRAPAPRYALVTGANTKSGVDAVQSLLLMGSNNNEIGAASADFGFGGSGFARVFCLSRDPLLPELQSLAEGARTLVVITVDLRSEGSIAEAAGKLPEAGMSLVLNNAGLSKALMIRLMGGSG